MFCCRSAGPRKGLIKALREKARVVMVPEYRTSRVCATVGNGMHCHGRLQQLRCKFSDLTTGETFVRKPYPLRVCPDCRVVRKYSLSEPSKKKGMSRGLIWVWFCLVLPTCLSLVLPASHSLSAVDFVSLRPVPERVKHNPSKSLLQPSQALMGVL